jgi:flavin reductase (DIM6/NTAB) family NADH-FMN oxidoreductase RutF
MKKSIGPKPQPMPAPVWLVGTFDAEDKPNIMTASWAGVCCSRPPCITVSLRKATYTYHCIMARQAYTVSVPSAEQVKQADFAGIISGRDVDKFAQAGLTAVGSSLVDAPYVAQCPVIMECRLLQTLELGLHTMFVGEVVDTKVEEGVQLEDGSPDADKAAPIAFVGGQYRAMGDYLGDPFSIGKDL